MIKDIFEKSKTNKDLLGIRLYDSNDDFWCGYIEDYNEHVFQFRNFDRYGAEDGILIEQMDAIESIDLDSDYITIFTYFVREKNDFDLIEPIPGPLTTENWRAEYLETSRAKNEVISIEFNHEYVVYGLIMDLGEEEFVIEAIGKLGENEGSSLYKISNISAMRMSDIDCRFREGMYKWRRKTGGR